MLEPNECTVLLGMDFLRKAKRCLSVSVKGVVLTDEEMVDQMLEVIAKHAASVAAGSSGNAEPQIQAPPTDTASS